MRSEISRIQQLLKKAKEYQELIVIKQETPLSNDNLRLDLIKRWKELEVLIIEANGGELILDDQWKTPLTSAAFSTTPVWANSGMREITTPIMNAIAYFGGKRVEIIPRDKTILFLAKEWFSNIDKFAEDFDAELLGELKSVNKLLGSSEVADLKKVALGCRNIIISLSKKLCMFPAESYYNMDCAISNEKNRLIAYLRNYGEKKEKVEAVISFIYDTGSKGKSEAIRDEVVWAVILTYGLLNDIKNKTNFEILKEITL